MIDLIRVQRTDRGARVFVGDVEIPPDAIRRNSVFADVDPDDLSSLDLSLVARRIEIDNESEG